MLLKVGKFVQLSGSHLKLHYMTKLKYLFGTLFFVAMVFSCSKNETSWDSLKPVNSTSGIIPITGANNGGNITCDEVSAQTGCTFEMTSGRMDYEDYPDGGTVGPITWTTDGVYVNWTSTVPVKVAIIVKGGPNASVYFEGCDECLTSGTNLSAPINPNNGKPYGLSNITFCYSLCEPENGKCETAFARKTYLEYAHCFLDLDLDNDGTKDFDRWGWTNGIIPAGSTTYYNIYAGAGQCDVSKGTLVGEMRVEYYNGTAKVYIEMNDSYTMDETHLYIGSDKVPLNNGTPTVAPGQYPYSHDLDDEDSDYYEVSGLSGGVYIILHAVVCGFE